MTAIPSIHDSAFEETDAERAGINAYMGDTENCVTISAADSMTDDVWTTPSLPPAPCSPCQDNDSAFYSEGTEYPPSLPSLGQTGSPMSRAPLVTSECD